MNRNTSIVLSLSLFFIMSSGAQAQTQITCHPSDSECLIAKLFADVLSRNQVAKDQEDPDKLVARKIKLTKSHESELSGWCCVVGGKLFCKNLVWR
jgi:hypothetical protein